MTFLRTAAALAFTLVLTACGGQYNIDAPVQTAALTTSVSATQDVTAAAPTRADIAVASSTMPAADCAAEGCASLRIIDGNAEAWRIDAQRRDALEARLSQS